MELEIAVLSQVGGRSVNEDACGCWSRDGRSLCVVSDGAGGHQGGAVASKLVVKETLSWFRDRQECTGVAIEAALRHANEILVREQKNDVANADMRATAVVLAVDSVTRTAAWGHLGDSRLYCFRDNRIVIQTRDHSLVQRMVDAGILEPENLRRSPERSKLLNAMGDQDGFEPRLQSDAFALRDKDKFLLCTDGLWEYVEETEMEAALEECRSAEDWLRALELCVLGRVRGMHDNYSAVAVWCNRSNGGARSA